MKSAFSLKSHYDYIIVGSGLFGAVFAHEMIKRGKTVLVIEKREHFGGNIYCEEIEGINVHKYGAHIFHTSHKGIWDYVNAIVPFNNYVNSPVANYKGRLYNLPFNMNTFYQMWGTKTPAEAKSKIDSQRRAVIERMNIEGKDKPQNLEEQARLLIGDDIFETLIKGYTEKQWGRQCSELPAFIIKRLPVRFRFDNNYFNDPYQGIPIGGYNKLIEGLFQGADMLAEIDFFDDRKKWLSMCDRLVFTGKIDEFFNYRFGKLEYRTVFFEHETLYTDNYQGNAVVNYTEAAVPYTRIIEHKHFEFGNQPVTVISREYSTEWQDGMEPYYPVNDDKNNELAERYRLFAEAERNVIFGGRLAQYRYYDMDKVIEQALEKAEREKE